MRKYEPNHHNVIIDKPLLRVVLGAQASLERRGFPKKEMEAPFILLPLQNSFW